MSGLVGAVDRRLGPSWDIHAATSASKALMRQLGTEVVLQVTRKWRAWHGRLGWVAGRHSTELHQVVLAAAPDTPTPSVCWAPHACQQAGGKQEAVHKEAGC